MPIFEYQALAADGREVSGHVHGTSEQAVADRLRSQGLQLRTLAPTRMAGDPLVERAPVEAPRIVEAPPARADDPLLMRRPAVVTEVMGPLVGRVPLTAVAFFFRQLATMMDAGVNPVQSMDTLSNQSTSPKLRTIIKELREHTLAGRPMSYGMQRYPEVFSPLQVSLIRSGEEGGYLVDALSENADYLDREIELRNLIRRTTFYPKLVVVMSILIIGAANLIISSVAPSAPVSLSSPLTTWSNWLIIAPVLIGLFLFVRVGLHNPRVKYVWDSFVSHLPILGGVSRKFAMAKFGRAFGALYRGGVPLPKALHLAADSCGNEFLRARMYPAAAKLETGAGITDTLRATEAFNPIVLDMMATGETTGSMDKMLTKMSEYYEDEAGTQSVQLGHVLGVLALLAVCVYVGYVVISFYSGYFSGVMNAAGGGTP